MISITVVGFGNVGALLSAHLLENTLPIQLNIMEPSEDKEGALVDLAHTLAFIPNKTLHHNDEKLFLTADFIFYTAGIANQHGASRLSTAKENMALCKEIFGAKIFKKSSTIIVISNPVDLISRTVYHYSRLPANQVIGTGTLLDSIRLSYYLSSISNSPVDGFESWVLGEHGASQVPIYSACKFQEEPLLANSFYTSDKLDHAAKQTKNAAYHIRQTQVGTKYGVVKCAATIFEYIYNGKENLLPLSVLTTDYYRELLQLEQNIYISLPVKLKNGKTEVIDAFKMSEKELHALRRSAKILSEVSK
ncbi:MAG: hypothetical protein RJQ00_05830 [Vicingaceae bacterium]